MKISVIIPVYNRTQLVKRAVESVQQQTYAPAEIIVVDDGSTDISSSQFLEKLATSSTNALPITSDNNFKCSVSRETVHTALRVLRQAHKGVAAARNLGVKHAKGDWLAFLDSDDYWLLEKLEKQVQYHEANPQCVISQTDEVWIRNGVRINPNKPNLKVGGDIFERSLERCMISPSAVLLHKSILDIVGSFDESLPVCEDYDLWLRITCRFEVGLVPEKLVIKHGGHSDQLSRKYEAMDRFRIKALQKILASGNLTKAQKKAAEAMLAKKTTILENGARKRNRIHPPLPAGRQALIPSRQDPPRRGQGRG